MMLDEASVMRDVGEDGLARLVAAFYRRVKTDDVVGVLYPEDDWEGAETRLRDFLVFRFGGEDRYRPVRGHPRLRMRHLPFTIGPTERDRWLELMGGAMEECAVAGQAREVLWAFFVQVAEHMRNRE
jgi:hemoglobin